MASAWRKPLLVVLLVAVCLSGCQGADRAGDTRGATSPDQVSSVSVAAPAPDEVTEPPVATPVPPTPTPSASPASPSPGAPFGSSPSPPSPGATSAAALLQGCTVPKEPGTLSVGGIRDEDREPDEGSAPVPRAELSAQMGALVRDRVEVLPGDLRDEAIATFEEYQRRMDPRVAAAAALLTGYVPEAFFPEFEHVFEHVAVTEMRRPTIVSESLPGTSTMLVNELFVDEDPGLLSTAIVMHETLHHDAEFAKEEEATIRVLTSLVRLDQVADHPEMIDQSHVLALDGFTELFAIAYNSRTPLQGRCDNILPGTDVTVTNFYDEGPVDSAIEEAGERATRISPLVDRFFDHWGLDHDRMRDFDRDVLASLDIAGVIDAPGPSSGRDTLTSDDLVRVADAFSLRLPDDGE